MLSGLLRCAQNAWENEASEMWLVAMLMMLMRLAEVVVDGLKRDGLSNAWLTCVTYGM